MKIVIDIPEDFFKDYQEDKFKDCFERLKADINCCAGNYEKEICKMLIAAFQKSTILKDQKKNKGFAR